ncbi:hypothetical protein LTR84_008517 [Exophiala bonariae]|uniref:Major facilitator superfamily (MFS) profile domain-containing protein n=1 Tax=Exophiala bonariae TaxID=1690606 RepID=A0AAV9MYQ1_9EURO|nr:hypothetical protein LTR84_008517 [Exophiala bonariae]
MDFPNAENHERKPNPRDDGGHETAPTSNTQMIMDEDKKENVDTPVSREAETSKESTTTNSKKGLQFWLILVALSFTSLLTSLEATITSTALPSIIADLGGGDLFIWTANGYFLAMTALLPLYGQLANLFGRRWPTISAAAIFILGSGICGGTTSIEMLITGRVVQGVGASGIGVLVEMIVCDLVPLRQRGNYMAVVMGLIAIGTAVGPFIGGLIVDSPAGWRWVFWLNLPIGGVALVLLFVFLRVTWNRNTSYVTRLTSIDWVGNFILVGSTSSVLIALSWAGAVYTWSSYHVLVPLAIGLAGLALFVMFEGSRFPSQPTMPLHLMANRTSATAYILTLLHGIVTMWTIYFLPVYFQGVLGSSPSYSGVQLLPSILVLMPFAALGGVALSKFGVYRPFHVAGFALIALSFGLFNLLDSNSSTGAWVGYQAIGAAGVGLVVPTLLPAVMAPLTERDTALATSTWAFLRSFGVIWGTAIPAAIFNNRFDELATTTITDTFIRSQVVNGKAYSHATAAFLHTLSETTREEFIAVLNQSLRRTWQVGIGFAALGLALVFLEKDVPLRQELETEFGMEKKPTIRTAYEEDGNVK